MLCDCSSDLYGLLIYLNFYRNIFFLILMIYVFVIVALYACCFGSVPSTYYKKLGKD